MRLYRHVLAIAIAWTLTWLIVGFLAGRASAHDGYAQWKQADGTSCCSERVDHGGHVTGDCRPTRAFKDEEGRWRAWAGDRWIVVPARALLPPDLKHDGRSHLCEAMGVVYCFSPAEPRI